MTTIKTDPDRALLRARLQALGADPAELDRAGPCRHCGATSNRIMVAYYVSLEAWDLWCGACAIWCATGHTLADAVDDWLADPKDYGRHTCRACGLTETTVSQWAARDLCAHCAAAEPVQPRRVA